MMTVTSWGYDVVQYDADALILRNPSELFERHPDSDILASLAGLQKVVKSCFYGCHLLPKSPKLGKLHTVLG